jgi:hypothetical protein
VGLQSPWYSRRALQSILSNIHSASENVIYLVIRPLCTASKNLNTVILVEIEKQGGRTGFGFYVAEILKVWASEHRSIVEFIMSRKLKRRTPLTAVIKSEIKSEIKTGIKTSIQSYQHYTTA